MSNLFIPKLINFEKVEAIMNTQFQDLKEKMRFSKKNWNV